MVFLKQINPSIGQAPKPGCSNQRNPYLNSFAFISLVKQHRISVTLNPMLAVFITAK